MHSRLINQNNLLQCIDAVAIVLLILICYLINKPAEIHDKIIIVYRKYLMRSGYIMFFKEE